MLVHASSAKKGQKDQMKVNEVHPHRQPVLLMSDIVKAKKEKE